MRWPSSSWIGCEKDSFDLDPAEYSGANGRGGGSGETTRTIPTTNNGDLVPRRCIGDSAAVARWFGSHLCHFASVLGPSGLWRRWPDWLRGDTRGICGETGDHF